MELSIRWRDFFVINKQTVDKTWTSMSTANSHESHMGFIIQRKLCFSAILSKLGLNKKKHLLKMSNFICVK